MPDVIDSFMVVLGLDSTKFKAGTQDLQRGLKQTGDAVKKGAGEINERFKPVAQTILGLRRDLLGIAAIFLGGLGLRDFASIINNVDASTGRIASSIGMSVQSLSAWEGAIKRAGGSAQEADSFFKNLNSRIQQYAITGQPDQFLALFPNVKFFDAQGHERPAGDVFKDIIQQIQGLPKAQQTQILSMIGAGQGVINLAEMGLPRVNALLAEQQQRGLITPQQVKAAIDFQNAWRNIEDDIQTVGRLIVSNLEPALTAVFNGWDAWFRAHQQLIAQDIPKYIDEVRDALGGAKDMGYALLAVFAASSIGAAIKGVALLTGAVRTFIGAGTAARVAVGGITTALTPLRLELIAIATLIEKIVTFADRTQPQNLPIGSPFWEGVSPQEQGNYVNSPRSQAFLRSVGAPNYDPWNPGSWTLGQNPIVNFGGGGLPQAPQGDAATAASRRVTAYNYLRSQLGLTDLQAAGFVASLQAESDFRLHQPNPKSGAIGIAQWLGPRAALFEKVMGVDIAHSTFQQQLQFIVWELQNTEQGALARLRATWTAGQASDVVTGTYERSSPAEQAGSEAQRLGWANQIEYGQQFAAILSSMPPPVSPALLGPPAGAPAGLVENNNNTQIGPITITAPSGDAEQIATALKKRLEQFQLVSAANYGLG